MQIGERYQFVPHAFGAETKGQTIKGDIPRRLTGRITYINEAHAYFTVEAVVGAVTVRESFKMSEYKRR